MMTRERARLYLKFQYTPYTNSIFYNVMGIVKRNAEVRPDKLVRPNDRTSWVLRTQRILAAHERTHGVRLLPEPQDGAAPTAPRSWDCSRLAAVYGRAVDVMQWQAGTVKSLQREMDAVPQPTAFGVGSEASKRAAAAFFALGYNATPGQLGTYKSTTPLSARGPGCAGAILTSVSAPLPPQALGLLMGARTGAEGWHRVGAGAFDPAAHAAWAADRGCPSCGAPSAEGPYHACCECPGPAPAAARAKLVRSLPGLVQHLVWLAYDAIRPKGDTDEYADFMSDAARQLAERQDWTSPEGRFILFRLLTVATWPAAVPGCQFGALGTLLGTMFDIVAAKPHRLRPMANNWCGWAAKWLHRLHRAYYAPPGA